MRLLIINPNTTEAVTLKVADAAVRALPGVSITARSGRFGAAYISSRSSFAVAGHAALDCLAEHGAGADTVLLACFGDPGLDALREVSPAPVIGLVEASCAEAGSDGRRFAIVTGGELWGPMLREMIAVRGIGAHLTRIVTVAPTGGQIAADPEGSKAMLAEACRNAAATTGAQAVVLGGAGLLGLAADVERMSGVRVICSVEAGFRAAASSLASTDNVLPKSISIPATPSVGLSPALEAMFLKGRL